MTLYYPSGLYGPICDLQDPIDEIELVIRPITIDTPKIILDGDPEVDPTDDTDSLSIIRVFPKICRTIKVSSLYGGPFGPICDRTIDGGDDGSYDLCSEPPVIPTLFFDPIPRIPPKDPTDDPKDDPKDPDDDPKDPFSKLKIPTIECEAKTVELLDAFGVLTKYTYLSNCLPVTGDHRPDPELWGFSTKKKKPTYLYTHSLICGALDNYSSPGIYVNNIPPGISYVSIIAFGAGGGAGGGDQGNDSNPGAGNNSGGTGSFMKVGVNLDSSTNNILTIVVGGGGSAGRSHFNRPDKSLPGFNRGGYGGYPGPTGLSGQGGSGGGATDVYLNNRLILSVAGAGGGGGQGCNYFRASTGKPWGNWNNYSYSPIYPASSPALKSSRFSPLFAINMFEPAIKHSLWSNWFNEYIVWFNTGEETYTGKELENRVNLNFDVTGTYTFEMQGDNQLAVYIAPWYDPTEGPYVTDILYNGQFDLNMTQLIMSGTSGIVAPPATLPATIAGAQPWQLIGYTNEFRSEVPTSFTRNITSAGRYVLKFVLLNQYHDWPNDWLRNPSGMAVKIKRPNGSIFWTTRENFGLNGEDKTSTDGAGAGGGGGNTGLAGLSTSSLGLSEGSCQSADSTSQGGSAGFNYVLSHPAITLDYFDQAASTYHSGWNTPTTRDQSVRKGGGGFGGARPINFSLVFDNIEYPLYNSAGSSVEIIVPGMGNGVWNDGASGKTLQYHYFWGVSKDGPTEELPSGITDSDLGYLFFGSYQGALNCPACSRPSLYRARSFEMAFLWTPIKIGNTFSTKIRYVGSPPWGLGTGFEVNDILPGVMPPSRSQGTQPWFDIASTANIYLANYIDTDDGNKAKPYTKPNTSFNFSIRITRCESDIDVTYTNGQSGYVRTHYLTVDTELPPIEIGEEDE